MAEIFGVVVSAISVAALFNNVVDCFEYVQLGRNFGTDYQTCQLRLDIARLRLSRWGAAVNINSDARFDEATPTNNEVLVSKSTLEQVLALFASAYMQSSSFKLTAKSNDLVVFDPSLNANQAINGLQNSMLQLSRKRQKRTSLSRKISWALYKQKFFTRLIDDIQELLDGLEKIFPLQEEYRRLVETEVQEFKDDASLLLLSEVSSETDTLLKNAAIQKLDGLKSSNIVDKAKVLEDAKVKVGNEYTSQGLLGSHGDGNTLNKIHDLEAKGKSMTHIGNTFGDKCYLSK